MHLIPAFVLAPLVALVLPPAARAATLQTDARCYQETQEVVLSGTGFTPLATINVMLDGKLYRSAIADATGAFVGKFPTPELGRNVREQVFDLSATDTLNTAATRYRSTRIFADFAPRTGDPKTLQVRFTINGFGLRQSQAPVYLHWVDPDGKARKTAKLGTTKGTCGVIRKTMMRRLFPFTAERGRWILQFDTRKSYSRATSERKSPWVRKPVEISAK